MYSIHVKWISGFSLCSHFILHPEQIYFDALEQTLKIFFLPQEDEPRPDTPPPHDQRHVERFLSGDYCLQGGTGWWKYEFCYGKRVSQFHVERGERAQEILLGQWNQRQHKAWIDANSARKVTAKGPNHVIHFYTGGDLCQVTDRPRTVKVKLICKSIKGHPDAVSIFLQEPKPCEYTLTVESSIVCHILNNVDEYGLPADETPVDNHYHPSRPATPTGSLPRQVPMPSLPDSRRLTEPDDSESDEVEEIDADEEDHLERDAMSRVGHGFGSEARVGQHAGVGGHPEDKVIPGKDSRHGSTSRGSSDGEQRTKKKKPSRV